MDPLSSLLSIAGQNRRVGSGDVVPYQRTSTDSPDARETQAARPGPASPGVAFDPMSSLANLSALTPGYNAALQAQLAGAIPSGTASAVAQPLPVAQSGPSSTDVTASQAQIGSTPIAGAPGTGLAPAPAPSVPAGGLGSTTSGAGDGTAGGIGGTAAGGEGGPGAGSAGDSGGPSGDGGVGDGGTGDGGGVGDGSGGVFKKGGFVTQGNPKSKTDDVSAKLQHGEFVIPRDAVIHLAAHAPQVLSHVMHVSAMHHLANKAAQAPAPGAMLTGQNGGMPPQAPAPQGFRNGGLVMPGAAVPQVHPAAMDLIRRAIAAHTAPQRPMVAQAGPPQAAGGSAPVVQGRPPAVPPMERLDATKNATGDSRNSMTRKSGGI